MIKTPDDLQKAINDKLGVRMDSYKFKYYDDEHDKQYDVAVEFTTITERRYSKILGTVDQTYVDEYVFQVEDDNGKTVTDARIIKTVTDYYERFHHARAMGRA